MPTVRRVTVRLSPAMHSIAEEAAKSQQVPLAQYVREAVLMRVALELGIDRSRKRGQEIVAGLEELHRLLDGVEEKG